MKQWYEELFENYGNTYESEVFVKGTIGECDFIEQEAGHDKSLKILDIGCGTGRHSIELTKRGYSVKGVDLSESMLEKARQKAEAEGLEISFEKQDARALPFDGEFDLAIMLCEGGFPLMETDEMNFEILRSASKSLKGKGSKLIFTTLNGLFPLFHSVKEFIDSMDKESPDKYSGISFDLMTFREANTIKVADDSGNTKVLNCNERYYVPSEITWMLKTLGFTKIDIYGAKLGAYSRNDKLTTEDYEMLVIAEK
ncbi:MAG: class I SAM-dependent methyltransferase [Bacteroidota bacterium]